MNGQEIEAKFYVKDLGRIEARLKGLGGKLLRPRVHEVNLRFDHPDGSLSRAGRVLRLRQSDDFRLTYKGPSRKKEGAVSRQELEVTVGNFEAARQILEALGYQIVTTYEKYRATYELNQVYVFLDELPFGDFVEIEGPDVESIHRAARTLGLDWGAAIPASYVGLFERSRAALGLQLRDLSFSNYKDIINPAEKMDIHPADEP